MKKIIGLLSLVTFVSLAACSDQPAETKKEIIVVNPSPVKVVADPPAKATSISVDKNGVQVTTKKINVDLNKH